MIYCGPGADTINIMKLIRLFDGCDIINIEKGFPLHQLELLHDFQERITIDEEIPDVFPWSNHKQFSRWSPEFVYPDIQERIVSDLKTESFQPLI